MIDKKNLLPSLPDGLRDALFDCFEEITRNYRECRWEPSELNGGKICEVIYSILDGYISGTFPVKPSKPRNMVDACRVLEHAPSSFSRSVRIQIPRMLIALYEIRNNRGVGHAGGDINPNHMDATAVLYMSKWLLCEVIRIFHGVDTKTANEIVEALIDRTIPIIWEVDGKYRVLKTDLSMRDKTLAILYQVQCGACDSDLAMWVEHSNPSVYRRNVLKKLHEDRFVEYDAVQKTVKISPSGITHVEDRIL